MTLAALAALLCLIGLVQALAGAALVARFGAGAARQALGAARPAVTVLKPLHGDEPLLEQALASVCAQDYPDYQVVFGVDDRADQALSAVRRVQARFPTTDIAVVCNPTSHGANSKVGNLINMLPAAKHDVLAIADSDLHAAPDYLARLADALAAPGTGLVTTIYAGLPASTRLAARLAAMQITHIFLPGALLARATGRQDCLGATMLLRRDTLARVGGLEALVDHLADDQVLGRRVQALGLAVRLAHTVPATTVPETTISAAWRHELRWARTIRALVPGPFAASVLQYPLFWALLAIPLSVGALWSCGLFLFAWIVRSGAALWVDRALKPLLSGIPNDPYSARTAAFASPVRLFPLRDLMSVAVMLTSYASRRVEWRGQVMTADTPDRLPPVGLGPPPRTE
jgi:ceramide glucosyltransferase